MAARFTYLSLLLAIGSGGCSSSHAPPRPATVCGTTGSAIPYLVVLQTSLTGTYCLQSYFVSPEFSIDLGQPDVLVTGDRRLARLARAAGPCSGVEVREDRSYVVVDHAAGTADGTTTMDDHVALALEITETFPSAPDGAPPSTETVSVQMDVDRAVLPGCRSVR
jgi:hypothetical protein